jgi:hypothetical protein
MFSGGFFQPQASVGRGLFRDQDIISPALLALIQQMLQGQQGNVQPFGGG